MTKDAAAKIAKKRRSTSKEGRGAIILSIFLLCAGCLSMSSSFVDVHPWCLALQFVGRGGGFCMLSVAQPIQAIARLVVYVDLLV